MNRSILIVICDFLLVSLLAFSTVDLNKVTEESTARPIPTKLEITSTHADTRQDLASVMKLALEDERRTRDRLVTELTQTKDVAGKQQILLAEREKLLAEEKRQRDRLAEELNQTKDTVGKQQNLLSERDKLIADKEKILSEREKMLAEGARQIQAFQQSLQLKEQQTQELEKERKELEERLASTQSSVQNLQQQLQASTTDSVLSREKIAAAEAEIRRQQEQAATLRGQLKQLESNNQLVEAEKQHLVTQLKVVETEKRSVTEQLAKTSDDIRVERAEKARLTEHADKLADGVKTLAARSGEIAQEMRVQRPLSPNSLFNEFSTNRVHARFIAHRSGLLGLDLTKRRETETVLITDGTNYFALCHIDDTPVSLGFPGTDWESLKGTLSRSRAMFAVGKMVFHQVDPRIILIPITPSQARDLGCRVYRVAADPFSFQEAVLIGAREGYYGECKFQIDLTTPEYLKMDHSMIRGLFGKFNPSHGDLVFNKAGDLIGMMANNSYCVRLTRFAQSASLRFGEDMKAERTSELLSQLYTRVEQMPFKLQ